MSSHLTFSARLDDVRSMSFDSDEETATGSDYKEELTLTGKASQVSQQSIWCTMRSTELAIPSIRLTFMTKGLRHILLALLPSFVGSRISSSSLATTKSSKSAIAALDGLRGVACLFVFNEHFSYNYSHSFLYGYGVEDHRSIIQWPFIRILWSGFSMVAIFFVISGYVLSYKPLKQIRTRQAAKLQQTLSSSVFRRAIRLYLPSMIAVVLCGLLTSAGAFRYATIVARSNNPAPFELHESTPPHYDNFFLQIGDAIKNAFWMTYFWRWDSTTTPRDYDLHLWTIPTEFRCSLVLFLTIMATSRLRTRWRLSYVVTFIVYCIATNRRDVLLFLSGMLLAEIDLIRIAQFPILVLPLASAGLVSKYDHLLPPLLFIMGLFFASSPVIEASLTPGYRTLCSLISRLPSSGDFLGYPGSLLQCLGAVLITWSVANSPPTTAIARIFTNPGAQYLGSISYALYLVHGNVLKSILYSLMPTIASTTGGFGSVNQSGTQVTVGTTPKLAAAWLMGMAFVLPTTIWTADLFWRGVDLPVVRFGRCLETRASIEWNEGEHGIDARKN